MKTKLLFFISMLFFNSMLFAQNDFETKNTNISEAIESFSKNVFNSKDTIQALEIPKTPIEKRQLKDNFREDYQTNEYRYEYTPSLWERFTQWLKNKLQSLLNTTPSSTKNILYTLKIIFYILVIGLAVYIIVKAILNKEGTWVFWKRTDSKQVAYSDIEENIEVVDFEKLIEQSIQNEDYRLAIRYFYLWILKNMNTASIIEYDPQKTNIDYQIELEKSGFSENFKKASYYYNYIWYGEFHIDANEFLSTSQVYKQLLKQVNNG